MSATAPIAAAQSITPAMSFSRKRARASSARASVRSAPSSRAAADASSSTDAGTEPANSSSIPSVNNARPSAERRPFEPPSTRAAIDRVRSASPAKNASAAAAAIHSAASAGWLTEQRRPLHRGRCGSVPLPGAALVSGPHQVLRELMVRAGGGFGSVPDPGDEVRVARKIMSASARWADRCSVADVASAQHRRTQQRVAEPQLWAVAYQHALVLSLIQRGGHIQLLPRQSRCHRCRGARAVEGPQQYRTPGRSGQAG